MKKLNLILLTGAVLASSEVYADFGSYLKKTDAGRKALRMQACQNHQGGGQMYVA